MKLHILYFASLRERLARASETVEVPQHIATAGALQEWLSSRGEPWHAALAPGRSVRMSVAQRMATRETVLTDGAEVAFFPPVTGG